jgi:hypothetical protein
MEKIQKLLREQIVRLLTLFKKSPRYIAVAGIFLLTVFYNLAIAVPPESPDVEKDVEQALSVRSGTVDIDREHPVKRYDERILSRKGDWYRVGLVAQSLDEDESLRISLVSSVGKTMRIGSVELRKDDGENYFEFVIAADGSYEDIVVEKVREESDEDRWRGGRVRLSDVFVSRLGVSGEADDVKRLQPTIFGEKNVQSLGMIMTGLNGRSDVKPPSNAHFIQGQTFAVSDDAYTLFVTMRIKQVGSAANGKYRLELRPYDSVTEKVGDEVLSKASFSAKDLKSVIDTDGSYRFDLPYRLEADKSYFLGVSDEYVKPGKRIQLEAFRNNADAPSVGQRYFEVSAVKRGVSQVGDPLTHAMIEDLGTSFRYRYHSNHTVTDMMDLFETSGKVSFDNESSAVIGKESAGVFFTYKIDTVHPFDDFRMEATQMGNDDNHIRVEYSFDNVFWKEIPVIRTDNALSFDELLRGDKRASAVYVRVSYAGSNDGSGAFGLSDFRVTATMPKEVAKKLPR